MKRAAIYAAMTFAMITLLIGCNGCKEKDNPFVPPSMLFDIMFYNNFPPQADINESVPIAGWLTNANGERQSGYKVRFRVDPPSIGRVAPITRVNIDLNDPKGFDSEVWFVGEQYGIAVITGYAEYETGDIIASDTLSISVQEPGNEE